MNDTSRIASRQEDHGHRAQNLAPEQRRDRGTRLVQPWTLDASTMKSSGRLGPASSAEVGVANLQLFEQGFGLLLPAARHEDLGQALLPLGIVRVQFDR